MSVFLDLALGTSAKTKIWKNRKITWDELTEKLKTPIRTHESYKEFLSLNKEEQGKIKDVGGYVGAYLKNGVRKPGAVVRRQLITLDLDFAPYDFFDIYSLIYGEAAIVHSTHKHSKATPRYRLIIPLSRAVGVEEYSAISRKIAGNLGIEYFDNTTFEPSRLMFWPSVSSDGEYICEVQEGPFLNPEEVLSSYQDWHDASLWPRAEAQIKELKDKALKQTDPLEKPGIIGAFCRVYDIHQAIEKFLSDIYEPTEGGRYTYTGGTTAQGLVTYEDKFAYSHHSTDPVHGHLCNAFDLVRLHKFGHLDTGFETEISKTKSHKTMEEFVANDSKVKIQTLQERRAELQADFGQEAEPPAEYTDDWAAKLEKQGKAFASTISNVKLILENDYQVKGVFKENKFDRRKYIFNAPWKREEKTGVILNNDFSQFRHWLEKQYGISSNQKIEDALNCVCEENAYHPVRDYLDGLTWDGTPRLESLLVRYFGAENNVYTREATRKHFAAAVARIYNPGCKYDYVLALVSKEGTGKSTFIRKLSKGWGSDSFSSFTGKEAFESVQGVWLVEIAELSGLKRADIEAVKHFITKQEDSFRPAYGRSVESFKRQCIFFGTTNDPTFIKEPGGNRRFLPVQVHEKLAVCDPTSRELDDEVDQLWAEAKHCFKKGESLYLSREADEVANFERRRHTEADERTGMIEAYLNTPVPAGFDDWTIENRNSFFEMKQEPGKNPVIRDSISVAEIWHECLGKPRADMNRYSTRELNLIMRSLDDWEFMNSTKNFGMYGKQKYYKRKKL